MGKKVKIYGLVDPRNDKFFYVGSSVDPSTRFATHTSNRFAAAEVHAMVSKLADDGAKPILRILEVVDPSLRKERERYWMDWLRSRGHRLANRRTVGIKADEELVSVSALVTKEQARIIKSTAEQLGVSYMRMAGKMLELVLKHANLEAEFARLNFPTEQE